MPSQPYIDWSRAELIESGRTLRVPVGAATPEWCASFKLATDTHRRAARQGPWGEIGLIGDVIFVPGVAPGAEELLRETLQDLTATAQRRVAAAPPPESPADMLELMRSLSG